ncbi:hypothetical protein ACQJBY_022505 [Aegilops geniculata]
MTRPASASSRATSSTAPPHAAAAASSTSPRPAPSTVSWTPRYCCSVTVMLLFDLSVQGRVCLVLWPHKVRRSWWRRTWDAQRVARCQGCRGMRRVVVTSAVSAVVPSPGWPVGEVLDEHCWTNIDYCDQNRAWYPASNTLAEKAAWKFEEEIGLHAVVVNPGTILGPMIPPRINASMAIFLHLLEGLSELAADSPNCSCCSWLPSDEATASVLDWMDKQESKPNGERFFFVEEWGKIGSICICLETKKRRR